MTGHSLVEKAITLALRAHTGQTRKESSRPYIVHPIAVALILARQSFSDTVIAAAIVHDVIEDTQVTEAELRTELGDAVVDLVMAVTYDDSLPRDDRKKSYIESVRSASEEVKALSAADKIANAQSLLASYAVQGQGIWKYFNTGRDKKLEFENAMLKMLRETWRHPLVDEYATLVKKMNALA